MITEIIMPQLGTTMTEGTVDRWLKQVGDAVSKGEPLLEISTDKYTTEINSETDGFLRQIAVPEGSDVPVKTVLGLIAGNLEEAIPTTPATASSERPDTPKAAPEVPSSGTATDGPVRFRVTPLAKKTAKKLGIDLAAVQSRHVRIKNEDVLRHYDETQRLSSSLPVPPSGRACEPMPATVPLTPMRRIIGARMTESLATAPQVTELREVRVDALIALRQRVLAYRPDIRVSYGDLFAKIVATALVHQPAMNTSCTPQGIVHHPYVHIGVAVALDDGLVVPVLRDVDRKGICQIAVESAALISKARALHLTAADTEGATFTISNLGSFGVDGFTPIVNLPTCGILGLGRMVRRPLLNEDDQMVPGQVMTLSLTFDHRVVDGATAAKLLALIAQYTESPETLLF